ncbi:MAG TPA: hypothetical protein VFY16_14250 [Gemmatimonadaceae bacterium]|nr:hypothetical protein [Gemmatimonadaceae bacterium]
MTPSDDATTPLQPALTPEEWQARDHRPRAAVIDAWAKQTTDEQAIDDRTRFAAKLGLTSGGDGVLVMSRAHEVVLVPPPARHALVALALADQPYGFTPADLAELRRVAAWVASLTEGAEARPVADMAGAAAVLRRVAARIEALLPPASVA